MLLHGVDDGAARHVGAHARRGSKRCRAQLPETPKALLVISGHWEEDVPTVLASPKPPLYYDYYGFPKHTYELAWPAPGSPELAARVRALLEAAGIASKSDDKRGFDHGVFVPLKVAFPDAAIPTVQLSLEHGLDPKEHLAIGRALAPLRDEGVLIVGSGMSYHNMRGFMSSSGRGASERFDAWLEDVVERSPSERDRRARAMGRGARGAREPSARRASASADGRGRCWRERHRQAHLPRMT